MKPNRIVIFVLLIAVVFTACSCGAKVDYPVLEAVSLDGRTLTDGEYGNISASYEADNWEFNTSMNTFALNYIPAMNESFCPNINVLDTGEDAKALTPKLIDRINKELEATSAENGITILSTEKMMFNDNLINVIATESTVTDSAIDLLIEQGMITEELIEMIGGREALIASSSCYQTQYYAIIDGSLIVMTGSYDLEGVHKDTVIEQMNVLMQTLTVK